MICTGGGNVATNMKVKYSKAGAIKTRKFKYQLTHRYFVNSLDVNCSDIT